MTGWADQKAMIDRRGTDLARLLRRADDANRRVRGLDWSVAELGAHLVSGATRYREMAMGARLEGRDDMAATNARLIDEIGTSDLDVLAARLEEETATLLVAFGDDPGAPFPWYDLDLRMAQGVGTILGDYLVHGVDLSRTLGEPWAIDRAEALTVVDALVPILPNYVDPEGVAGVRASIELRLRGREPLAIAIADGAATVSEGPARRPDLTVSADPVAYLLSAYGRSGPWKPALSGKIVAWGRRPSLALRLPKFFLQP